MGGFVVSSMKQFHELTQHNDALEAAINPFTDL